MRPLSLLFNPDGGLTLWFAFGELYNWHASVFDDFNPVLLPISACIRSAAEFFMTRQARFREDHAGNIAHFCFVCRDWLQMDSAEHAHWHFETFPRIVQRELGFSLFIVEDGHRRLKDAEDMRARACRWHWRVRREREAQRLTPEQIAALLEAARTVLHARLGANRDVVERILPRAQALLEAPVRYV
jgi:hypothetical protein